MDITGLVLQTIQNLGLILVLGGMLIAFLWKAAAIINFIFGFVLTVAATYVVYSLTRDLGSTAGMLITGLAITGVVAALGALACMLEGFGLSALGFWGVFVAGSPYSPFSSGLIIGAVVASLLSTGVAVFLGGRVLSTKTLGLGKKPIKTLFGKSPKTRTRHEIQRPGKRILPKVDVLSETPTETDINNHQEHAVIVDRQEYLAIKNQVRKQLENLKKETERGKVNKETSERLRKELEEELETIDKDFGESLRSEIEDLKAESSDIDTAIVQSKKQIAVLDQEMNTYSKHQEEIEARFRIGQITKKEFHSKKKTHEQKIEEIKLIIAQNKDEIQQMQQRQSTISEALKTMEAELNHDRPSKS